MTVLALSLVLASAWAADISGTWKGSMDMMGQAMELSFTFKADGNTFTGTTAGPQGGENQVTNGKIDGDKISFTVKTTGQMEMTINYSGTVKGDEMKLTMAFDFAGMGGGMGGGPGGGAGGPGGGAGGPGAAAGGPGGGGPGGGFGPPPELVLKKVK